AACRTITSRYGPAALAPALRRAHHPRHRALAPGPSDAVGHAGEQPRGEREGDGEEDPATEATGDQEHFAGLPEIAPPYATPTNPASVAYTCSSDARVTSSPWVCAMVGSPGPKLSAGIPRDAKRATSVHPSLGRTGSERRRTKSSTRGSVRFGGAAACAWMISTSSAPSSSTRTCASASSGEYFGANRRFTVMVQRSGTTLCLSGMPPSMPTTWKASRNSSPSTSTTSVWWAARRARDRKS